MLADKIGSRKATVAEQQEYQLMYEARGKEFFSGGAEAFFDVQQIEKLKLPPKAPRAPSVACELCGEMVMQTKLAQVGGHMVCRGCQD